MGLALRRCKNFLTGIFGSMLGWVDQRKVIALGGGEASLEALARLARGGVAADGLGDSLLSCELHKEEL